VGFVVLKAGAKAEAQAVEKDVVAMVRDRIGPVAALKTVMVVARLPKTRSGKILRGTMRSIANGESYRAPATIDDPATLDEISAALKIRGMAPEPA
jgi:propionyl-CoA synthetase